MAVRDPKSGKFVSQDDFSRFDDIAQMHSTLETSVPASDVGGQTGQTLGQFGNFEGEQLYEIEEIIDRGQVAALLWAHHRLIAYIGSTQTADGTVRASFEVSSSANRTVGRNLQSTDDIGDASGNFTIESSQNFDDTADIIGPVLEAVGYGPITDGANGVGGAGTAGFQDWEGPVMVSPVFDDRDDIIVNGSIAHSNVSDAALHADLETWHVWGILEE